MKKILFFLLAIIGLCGYSQDEYYRKVDWKFYPENVIQLTDSTYLTDAYPFDYNDVGAIQRVVGNYVVDFVGHRYSVIDSTSTTITVLDIYHIGQAPQTGQIARCYRSVGNGEAEYIGSIDYSPLDESSRWKLNGSDNELLWRQTIGKAENGLYKELRTVKLGGDLTESTTINQDDNSFKILNNRHGSVFSETGIAYTKIDTVDFTDSTLVTKMYVKSLIKEGTSHDSLTIAPGSTPYFEVNYPQIFSGQKLIDSLGVINTKIAGKEPILTKGNLTSGSSKVTIGGTGTDALIGAGASIDVNEGNIVHQNISGSGTNTHAQIDTHITNDGDLSSTNEIQDLSLSGNTLSLSGDASTVDLSGYAPESGSANYVWNQFEVPQNASQYISGSTIIGEKTTIANQKALFFGNSVTEMGRFSKKICQSIDLIEDNRGIGGTTMHNFYLRYSEIPIYTNEWKYVFIDYGINDVYQGYSVSDFSINLGLAIDQFIAKGWPLNTIIAITPNYISDTSYNLEDYADAVVQVSKNKGIKYTNTYWYMKDNGGADLLSDAVHPSEVGSGVMAESILMGMYGGLSTSNSTVIGKSIHVGKNIYSGTYTGVPLNFINNGNTQIFPKNFISHRILSSIGTASGIDLTNNEESEGDTSPAISFSSLSHGGLYNSNYAYIHGVYQGYDASNPSFATGDIVFGTSDVNFAKERMRLSKLGHLGLGYSTGSEITNYMFSCNGPGYFNGNVGIQVSPWLKLTLPATSTNYALGFDYTGGEADSRRWSIGNDAYEYGSFSISTESVQGSNFSDLVRFYISKLGVVKIPDISGTSTRIVTASSIGELSTLTNDSGYLYNDGTGAMSFTSLPSAVTSISAGDGMNFTTITGTGSITLGTPSSLTASTTNAVTTTSHTHQITGFLPLTGGTLTGAVTSNNSFTGTNFILSSDKRLKQGIRTLTNTDWVERIKFVRYEMKSNPEIERYGVIAQDVEEVNKYLVHTDEYGIKSVSYIDLLVAKIANLEKRISELENKKKRHEK